MNFETLLEMSEVGIFGLSLNTITLKMPTSDISKRVPYKAY
jgi:hypothetical protein